ncbi:MAG TPA: hypothetical protein VFS25_16070 [Chitinophaga sp.]|uniref:DUF6934 family protein n=1 Tax=Chitinophaga sp. TaxID=1869181 RepID=UPI002DBBBF6D|nr:hypothetical protein [Chitinophaga sp.]HEU4554364.1 hypothetical protein [Chitinophaga sp.]
MALNVKINFDHRYELDEVNEDLSTSSFTTVLKDGSNVQLGIQINDGMHPLLPNVYNLAFGPIVDGQIDDKAKLAHADHSRAFSTIIFAGMTFLLEKPGKYVGIDGSNNARAYMYYRCIQNNFDYLSRYFKIYGVNYFVRILRKTKDEDQDFPVDAEHIIAIPRLIAREEHLPSDKLYNYFIFNLI